MRKRKRHSIRQQQKRAARKVRSRWKQAIRRGATPSYQIRKTYRLGKGWKAVAQRRKNRREALNYMWNKANPLRIIHVPKVFCFRRNPKGTVAFLAEVHRILFADKCRNLHISHEETEKIGLAASYIFDAEIAAARRRWKSLDARMDIGGKLSKVKSVNNFLLAFGILMDLGIDPSHLGRETCDLDYFRKYETIVMGGTRLSPHLKSNACTGLANYFDTCLAHNGLRLTDEGRGKLVDAFGEIIDNAEEHGGENAGWIATGAYEKETGECNFAIINIGRSIFESLSDETSTAREVVGRITDVVHSHRTLLQKAGDLIKGTSEVKEEPIWNVMALQEGISSKRTATGQGATRGQGLMDMLEFLNVISSEQEKANISVLSGHSSVLIDFKYPITRVLVGAKKESVRQIAFNVRGNLHELQDPEKVVFLDTPFTGTIITGVFKIDRKYLMSQLEKNGKDNRT